MFEDGRGLDDATMQAIGRQFNLSEITFIFPDEADGATARFRIFTPDYEMPFAGHPSLGTAQVVRELYGPGNELTLRCQSGIVSLTAQDEGWSLVPPRSGALNTREAAPGIAKMLGLDADALAGPPQWHRATDGAGQDARRCGACPARPLSLRRVAAQPQ